MSADAVNQRCLLYERLRQRRATPTHKLLHQPYQTSKVSPSAVADVELLKTQIQFLQDANTRLNNSFGSFVSAINLSFVVLALILGVAGAWKRC